jgi:NAD(P)-dependent dehydrogenase (short-subunit alcohol dehydrogenase family)
MDTLNGRVAVITGGGSGIGAAMARAFVSEGMRVVLADIDPAAMDEVAAAIGGDVLTVPADTAKLDDVRAVAERATAHFGAVHVVCNNAGVGFFGPIETTTHRDWQWLINVNLWGVIHGVEVFVPHLIAQGQGGHIVNTASMAGLCPMVGLGAYVTTKYAVVGLTETLQRELKPHGIGVSVLCPMIVNTNINTSERNRPPELRNPGAPPVTRDSPPAQPAGEMAGGVIEPDEVAARVVSAIKRNELYILTHAASREIIRRRFERIDRAAANALGT